MFTLFSNGVTFLMLKKKKINLILCTPLLWLCNYFSLSIKLYFDYQEGLVKNKKHDKIILWWCSSSKCEEKTLQLLMYILSELNSHFNILK